MSNVKITEVAEDPSKVKVTLSDLRAAVDRLEAISPGSVREDIHLSISGGQLHIDYYYTPPVAAKMIDLNFVVTKDGASFEFPQNKEHRPMCFDNPGMAGTTASAISDGETDMLTEPISVVDFSMVKNPEPWAVVEEIPIPAWAMKKRISAGNALREFTQLLQEKR